MSIQYRLSVDIQHVVRGLKMFATVARKVKVSERAAIGFDGVCLTVEWRDMRFFARASGAWPGTAWVNAALVHALAAAPPKDDPLAVTCDGSTVTFGPVKLACKWEPISEIALASDAKSPEWVESIALKYTLPRVRIDAAGRMGEVQAAERKLGLLIRRVARTLAPFGVSEGDVTRLVEQRLRERYSPHTEGRGT